VKPTKAVRNTSKLAEVRLRKMKRFLILDRRAMALLLGAAKTAPIEPFAGINVPVPAGSRPQLLLLGHDLLIAARCSRRRDDDAVRAVKLVALCPPRS
jgi:hypothetical protein